MMRRRRAWILPVACALAVTFGIPASNPANGKTRGWASKVTLRHPTPALFVGKVSSKLAACRTARLVNLYYTDPGTGDTSLLSVQRTNKKARYRVDLVSPAYAGGYQAIVAATRVRALQRPQKCRGDKGRRLTVG
jgi:hypothetical protein